MVRRFVATGGLGMKGVDTIARIRREHFVRGKSIKEIVRELHVSRNTVRKVLRTGATAFSYEREVQPLPRIGPWREALDGLLAGNEGKPARERLTLIRIFEELRNQGYEGSYDALRRYAKGWRRAQATMTAAAYVPLSFAPGEAYQFDWSHEIVLINGTTVSVRVAHVRLCHSRMLFLRAYPLEAQEKGPVDLPADDVEATARIHAPGIEQIGEQRLEVAAAGLGFVRHLVEFEKALLKAAEDRLVRTERPRCGWRLRFCHGGSVLIAR